MEHGTSKNLDLLYDRRNGYLFLCDGDDNRALIARGYAGKGEHLDKPESEHIFGQGPLPSGLWRIYPPADHPRLGPTAFRLEPVGDTEKKVTRLGRGGFFIHGDNAKGDRSASSGCIVLDRSSRLAIAALRIRCIVVV